MGEAKDEPTAERHRAAEAWRRRIMRLLPFLGRGLSDRTINALIAAGIDLPERLLFMRRSELLSIPHIGEIELAEIEAYQIHISKIGHRQS